MAEQPLAPLWSPPLLRNNANNQTHSNKRSSHLPHPRREKGDAKLQRGLQRGLQQSIAKNVKRHNESRHSDPEHPFNKDAQRAREQSKLPHKDCTKIETENRFGHESPDGSNNGTAAETSWHNTKIQDSSDYSAKQKNTKKKTDGRTLEPQEEINYTPDRNNFLSHDVPNHFVKQSLYEEELENAKRLRKSRQRGLLAQLRVHLNLNYLNDQALFEKELEKENQRQRQELQLLSQKDQTPIQEIENNNSKENSKAKQHLLTSFFPKQKTQTLPRLCKCNKKEKQDEKSDANHTMSPPKTKPAHTKAKETRSTHDLASPPKARYPSEHTQHPTSESMEAHIPSSNYDKDAKTKNEKMNNNTSESTTNDKVHPIKSISNLRINSQQNPDATNKQKQHNKKHKTPKHDTPQKMKINPRLHFFLTRLGRIGKINIDNKIAYILHLHNQQINKKQLKNKLLQIGISFYHPNKIRQQQSHLFIKLKRTSVRNLQHHPLMKRKHCPIKQNQKEILSASEKPPEPSRPKQRSIFQLLRFLLTKG